MRCFTRISFYEIDLSGFNLGVGYSRNVGRSCSILLIVITLPLVSVMSVAEPGGESYGDANETQRCRDSTNDSKYRSQVRSFHNDLMMKQMRAAI